jgi:tetratricopeptide (TPR) repeat protein
MFQHFNRAALLIALALMAGSAGCRSSIPRAQPLDITLPAPQQHQIPVSAADRAKYVEAVDLLQEGQTSRARSILERLELESAPIAGVHLNLALLHYGEEDYESARLQLDEAIRMSPLNAPAHNLDGSLLRRKGRFKEAQRAYAKAIKIDPDYAPAHYNIAVLFDIYLQYWIDAKEHYRRYQKLVGSPDQRVESWIQDLDLRIKSAGG